MNTSTKALFLCLLFISIAVVNSATITSITFTSNTNAIPPVGNTYKNFKPNTVASRIYLDTTAQRAYFYDSGTPAAATPAT